MFSYVIKRILLFVPTLLVVSCIAFFLSRNVSSDPIARIMELQGMDEDDINYTDTYNSLKRDMKYDLPLFYLSVQPSYAVSDNTVKDTKSSFHYPTFKFNGLENQYHHWIKGIASGDFGNSLIDNRPVFAKIWEASRWTILMVFLGFFFIILFSFPIGVYVGMNEGKRFDRWFARLSFAFYSIPKFWLATMLIIFFTTAEYGKWTNVFPTVGMWYTGSGQAFLSMLSHSWTKLILPLLVIIIPDIAYMVRLLRSSIIEEKNKEYVKTAMSKGMSESQQIRSHILPNALVPSITLLAGTVPSAVASSLVIEVIFSIPGLGKLMFDSITSADWSIVFPILFIVSVLVVVVYLAADILVAMLNPKIDLDQ